MYFAVFCFIDSDRFVFLLCTRAGGLGINLVATNIFGVVTQSISQFNPIPAPGAFETVIVNTMQPQTANKDIKMQSSVGSPTVVIS